MDVATAAIGIVVLIVFLTVSFVVDTITVAIVRANPHGKFKVFVDTSSSFGFITSVGTFRVSPSAQTLNYSLPERHGTLPFSAIKGLEYRANVTYATLLQQLFVGSFGIGRRQDTVEWFSIAVLTNDGERIPLYFGGRYMPRAFLMTWYIDLQTAVLEKLGLLPDAEVESRAALELVQGRLGNARLV